MSNLSGILGELQAEGVLRLYHDYRSGSLRDWSGFGNDGVASAGVSFTKKGVRLTPVAANITVPYSAWMNVSGLTWLISVDQRVGVDNNRLCARRTGATTFLDWYSNITTTSRYDGATARSLSHSRIGGVFGISTTAGGTPVGYHDGISLGNYNSPETLLTATTDPLVIGNLTGTSCLTHKIISYFLFISRVLTASEHQKLYQQLQQMSWPTKPYSRSMRPRYTEANSSGMQFRYSGAKRGGKYLDSSGNGNDSTAAVGTSAGKNGIGMCAGTSVVTSPVTTTTVPVTAAHSMGVFVSDAAILAAATYGGFAGPNAGATQFRYGGIHCDATNLSLTWYNGSAYRTASKAYNSALKHHVAYTISYADNIGRLYVNGNYVAGNTTVDIAAPASPVAYLLGAVGYSSPTIQSSQGAIGDGTLWNRALTTANIRKEWLQYAQMTQWKSGWGVPESVADESIGGSYVGQQQSPYDIVSGTWRITTRLLDGRWCKCLDCISAGTVWLDLKTLATNSAEAAYGSWAGRVFHAASVNPTILALTQSARAIPAGGNGHVVRVYDDQCSLSRNAAGTYTNLAVVSHTPLAPVDIHVSRRFDDVWQIYTRALGWSWTTVTSATDANYTVSQGMSLTANVGDYLVIGDTAGNTAWSKYLGEFDPREV